MSKTYNILLLSVDAVIHNQKEREREVERVRERERERERKAPRSVSSGRRLSVSEREAFTAVAFPMDPTLAPAAAVN